MSLDFESQTGFFLYFFGVCSVNIVFLTIITVTNITLMTFGDIQVLINSEIDEKCAKMSEKIQ